MTDDPYPSPSPVVTWITGSFIACLTLAVPLLAVSRVKPPYGGVQPKPNHRHDITHVQIQKYLGNTTLS